MEAPTTELEVFSAILLQEYIRLMTVATYIQNDNNINGAKFSITGENYAKMLNEPLQSGLIGLNLQFENDILTVIPNPKVLQQYNNKILKEVVLTFLNNYKNRYAKYIKIIE